MIAQWTTQSRTIAWNKKPIQFRRSLRDRRGPPIKSRLVRACRPTCTHVQKGWQTFRGCSLIPAPHGCQSTSEAGSQKPSLVTFIPPANPPSSSSGGVRFLTRGGARNRCSGDEGNVSFQLIVWRNGIIELEIYDIKIHKLRRQIISRSFRVKIYSAFMDSRAALSRVQAFSLFHSSYTFKKLEEILSQSYWWNFYT